MQTVTVKGIDPDRLILVVNCGQPLPDLLGSLSGKGDDGDRPLLVGQQSDNPLDQGVRFTGTGSGLDNDMLCRAVHRGLLLRVELPAHTGRILRRLYRKNRLCFIFFFTLPGRGYAKEVELTAQSSPFFIAENPDHPECPVKARPADHPVLPDAANCLGQRRGNRRNVRDGGFKEQLEFRAEFIDQPAIHCGYLFGCRPDIEQFREQFGQRDQAVHRRSAIGIHGRVAVGQFHHPVQNAYGQRPAALGADSILFNGLGRFQADATFTVTVTVVLPLFRIEFDGGRKMAPPLSINRMADGLLHGKEIKTSIEDVGLSAQFCW